MFKLVRTCCACPEQYDVYFGSEEVGYLRLRHGNFRADYRGETVYTANPKGDGIFEYDERSFYLNQACLAIRSAMMKELGQEEGELFTVDDLPDPNEG